MVSVVIPSYNREKTIKKAVESVLGQTYTDLEVIVVDDCSTDNTEEVVRSIDDNRVRYVRHETNKGACAARNTGIDNALGEFIAFQDSDDVWKTSKLEMQIKAIIENNADVSFCALRRFGYGDDEKGQVVPDIKGGFKTQHDIVMGFYVSTQTIVGRKQVFEKYRFDEKMPRMQDYDLMVRISETEKVYFVETPLVDVYLQDDSISVKTNWNRKISEVSKILISKYPELGKKYPEWKIEMLRRIGHNDTMQGIKCPEVYKEIYTLEKTPKNFILMVLSKMNLLKYYFKDK